jgi:Protein of unknown function (DUF5132)
LSHESHQQRAQASTDSNTPQTTTTGQGSKAGRRSAYFWGAASGVAFALFAPMLRPAARSAVKGGIRVGRYAKKVASNVKEEFEDIASEAQADLDREGKNDTKSND